MSNTSAVVHVVNISEINITLYSTLRDVLVDWDLLACSLHVVYLNVLNNGNIHCGTQRHVLFVYVAVI